MTNGIQRSMAAHSFLTAISLVVLLAPAMAQQPTSAQRDAIRANCRTDYEAHCASVPPGGKPALECLQKNMASLSAACQKAVGAIGKSSAAPAAAPVDKAVTNAAPAATQPAPPAAAQAPAVAQPPTAAATAPAPPKTVGAAAIAPPPPAISPPQEMVLVRTSCGSDFRAYCGNVALGGGRAVACLRANARSLSPGCQSALLGAREAR
jgi:hypothetical protein